MNEELNEKMTYEELANESMWRGIRELGAPLERRVGYFQMAQAWATLHLAQVTSRTGERENAKSDNKTVPNHTIECVHLEAGLIPNAKGELSVTVFTYCPKCGEKL